MKKYIAITALCITPVIAQDFGLNYEALSFVNEELATEVGGFTLIGGGGIDLPFTVDLNDSDNNEFNAIAQAEVRLERQFSNRWNLVLSYFGQYDTDESEYDDNVALFLGGAWGTAVVGNLEGYVNEQTRLTDGAGNAALSYDDHFGGLGEWGAGYFVRTGPVVSFAVIDEDSNFDLATVYQRPIGNTDYRFSLRYTNAEATSADGSTAFDTQAVSAVGEVVYGSSAIGISGGYEELDAGSFDVGRWYVSAGASIKRGVWTYSIEGSVGEIDGEQFASAALGTSYDIARGMSLNFGLNYADGDVTSNGVTILNDDELSGTVSFRYSF